MQGWAGSSMSFTLSAILCSDSAFDSVFTRLTGEGGIFSAQPYLGLPHYHVQSWTAALLLLGRVTEVT